MKSNKSIDGLTTRSARSPQSISTLTKSKVKSTSKVASSDPLAIKSGRPKSSKSTQSDGLIKSPSLKSPRPKSTPIKIQDDFISEDSLEISISGEDLLDDITTLSTNAATDSTNSNSSADQSTASPDTTTDRHPLTPTAKATDFLAPLEPLNLDDAPKSSSKSSKSRSEEPSKTKKKHISKARRIITIILLIIVLALIAGVGGLVIWGNDIIAKITGGQGNVFDLLTLAEETYEPLKTDSNGRTNVLAFGTSGYNMEGDEGNGTHDGAQLTDSIMMISFDQNTGDIAMLSLPRDLKASPTCTATGKINEVYWCNGGKGNISIEEEKIAADALMTEVGAILGVDFQYFAHLNWSSLIQIVDTLGGITITLDEDIHDYYWTGAVYDAGVAYTINGEQALGLARARHGTLGGDFSRGSSQQKILIGIKDKVFEQHLSITDLLSLASTLGDNLRTNFSLSEIKTLAHLTQTFDLDSIRQIALVDYDQNIYYMTTGTINGISYVLPSAGVGNYGAIQAYVAKNLSSDPRDYEEPTILVLNATDTIGLASAEQASLLEAGYTSVAVDDAPVPPEGDTYPTGTTLYALSSKPGSQTLLESYYDLTAEPASALPSVIPQYYDFIIILNPANDES